MVFRGAFRKAAMYSSSPQQYLPPQPEGPVLSPPLYALAAVITHDAISFIGVQWSQSAGGQIGFSTQHTCHLACVETTCMLVISPVLIPGLALLDGGSIHAFVQGTCVSL